MQTLNLKYINDYKNNIDTYGFNTVWKNIMFNKELDEELISELYEIGLAHINKDEKRQSGQYFTNMDVAKVMAKWFVLLDGENICDVCCGTGNLILSFFDIIGETKSKELIYNKQIYLYDKDAIAMFICRKNIENRYGLELANKVNYIVCDFLNQDIHLPPNSKVISNPPYFKITNFNEQWNITANMKLSKEFYSCIMEKILKESISSVIITPYSFISGVKFYELRNILDKNNGFIVSFDNVPGNIFSGKKHGIFNSNKSNSVRAAITVTENKKDIFGYRITPLIRFKTEERNLILNNNVLNSIIPQTYQLSDSKKGYYKCDKSLIKIFKKWNEISNKTFNDLIVPEGDYSLCVPNSCRYFTIASTRELKRTGKDTIYFSNEEDFLLSYCLLNSSFCYWYWRLYDGGVTYPLRLKKQIPIFFDKFTKEQKNQLKKIAKEMIIKEKNYLTYKKNAGKQQENIKFPDIYREKINKILLETLGEFDYTIINTIHQNHFFNIY